MNISKKFFIIMLVSLGLFSIGGYLVAKDLYDTKLLKQQEIQQVM